MMNFAKNTKKQFAIGACNLLLLGTWGCGSPDDTPSLNTTSSKHQTQTGQTPLNICNQDPRVWMGLVPLDVCAGARVFFDEDFNGNGRTCGSCHPAGNNFTVDKPFMADLDADDPLFIASNPRFDLSDLERSDLVNFTNIKENLDGFDNLEFKFVSRAVQHTLSLATSIARDPGDGTSATFSERTGWSGDGAPGNGSLRDFVDGAITQHFPIDLSRENNVSFRMATDQEKNQILAFQLALGRLNDLDLEQVKLNDPGAIDGQEAFIDPMRGRCNHCHQNAGANFDLTGLNRNFDTGVTEAPNSFIQQPDGSFLFDGGFGGQGLATPNHITVTGVPDAFGDGTFNTPPLIEAADTGPFFHNHSFGPDQPAANIEAAISFYGLPFFAESPAGKELEEFFGAPLTLANDDITSIGRFMRVLNAAFNLAIAEQRLKASRTLNISFWAYRDDIQKGLIDLSAEEVRDALSVLETAGDTDRLHPTEQTTLAQVLVFLNEALNATDPAVRRNKTVSALQLVQSAKSALGTGMSFNLGTGNLMF